MFSALVQIQEAEKSSFGPRRRRWWRERRRLQREAAHSSPLLPGKVIFSCYKFKRTTMAISHPKAYPTTKHGRPYLIHHSAWSFDIESTRGVDKNYLYAQPKVFLRGYTLKKSNFHKDRRWEWQYPGWYPSTEGWVHDQDLLLPATSRLPEPPPMPEPGTFLQIGISKGGSRKVAINVERSRKTKNVRNLRKESSSSNNNCNKSCSKDRNKKEAEEGVKNVLEQLSFSQLPLLANLETSPLAASSGGSNS